MINQSQEPHSPVPTKVDSTHKYNIIQATETGVGAEAPTSAPAIQMTSPFQDMLKREYDHAVTEEIEKGIRAISERFTRLFSQERTPTDVAKDSLGNTSDDYERIFSTYHSGNWQALAPTTEDLYNLLYNFDFTQMRKIEAIKQEYQQATT